MTEPNDEIPSGKKKMDHKPRRQYFIWSLSSSDPIVILQALSNENPKTVRLCDHAGQPGYKVINVTWQQDKKHTRAQMTNIFTRNDLIPNDWPLSWGHDFAAATHRKCKNICLNYLLNRIRELNDKLEKTKEESDQSVPKMSKKSKPIQKMNNKAPKKGKQPRKNSKKTSKKKRK